MVGFRGGGFGFGFGSVGATRHIILPHHDLGAVGGDPLQLCPVLQHHLLHKLDRVLQPIMPREKSVSIISWEKQFCWVTKRKISTGPFGSSSVLRKLLASCIWPNALWWLGIRVFLVHLPSRMTSSEGFAEGPKCSVILFQSAISASILFQSAISVSVVVAHVPISTTSGMQL